MELLGTRNVELKGKTKHQIIQYRYFGQARLWQFLEDDTALGALHPVKELPVLVVADSKGCKSDLQGGRGSLVEVVRKSGGNRKCGHGR